MAESEALNMSNKVNLSEVAKAAGVHASTVSLALRDHPRISLPVRRRIQKLAVQLGYRVNPLVSALMQSRRTGRPSRHVAIAFVTDQPTSSGWRPRQPARPDFFPGAERRAGELGYKLEHLWAESDMTPNRFRDILAARGVHGLIIGRLAPGQNRLKLPWDRHSCVALGMTLESPVLHHVTENHFDTVWQGMRRCIDYGYRRGGFVYSSVIDSPRVGERWLAAYFRQQLHFAAEDRLRPCIQTPPHELEFRAWFARERPDAILAARAGVILTWLRRMGVRVPADVGLVDVEAEPKLACAGVYHDFSKVGALAVEMLVGMMHRNETGVLRDSHEILFGGCWSDAWSLPPRHE